jgi:hypothetical protein
MDRFLMSVHSLLCTHFHIQEERQRALEERLEAMESATYSLQRSNRSFQQSFHELQLRREQPAPRDAASQFYAWRSHTEMPRTSPAVSEDLLHTTPSKSLPALPDTIPRPQGPPRAVQPERQPPSAPLGEIVAPALATAAAAPFPSITMSTPPGSQTSTPHSYPKELQRKG